ncbi:MAG: hypothetical protein U1E97_10945 [Alphaproteobacteria bacterium]
MTLFEMQARAGAVAGGNRHEIAVKRHIVAKDVARKRQAVLAFEQARVCESEDRGDEALALLRQAYRLDPDQAPIAAALVRRLAAWDCRVKQLKELHSRHGHAAHPLAAAFRDIVPDEPPIERAKRFERLARAAPDSVESHLA